MKGKTGYLNVWINRPFRTSSFDTNIHCYSITNELFLTIFFDCALFFGEVCTQCPCLIFSGQIGPIYWTYTSVLIAFSGAEGFTTEEEREMLNRIEKQLKRRFAIGSQVSQQVILQDFVHQQYPERSVVKVIQAMIRRGQLQHRMQRKMLYRIS